MVFKTYVDLSNAIPAFGVPECAALFRSALDKPLEEGSRTAPRAFQQIRGNTYRLEVSVGFNVINLTKVASFSFDLELISLEPVDHLESKVRDFPGWRVDRDQSSDLHAHEVVRLGRENVLKECRLQICSMSR